MVLISPLKNQFSYIPSAVFDCLRVWTVDLTGKVSNFPEVGLLQMYVGGEIYSSYNVSLVIKVKNKSPPKPGLKCHFCNLKYCLEEEREQHEEFWHSNRIKP